MAANRAKHPDPFDDEPLQTSPSLLERLQQTWARTGITAPIGKLMIKQTLPPTIILAAYQATSFADYYTTLGYLTAIISILTLAVKPRANFLQTLFISMTMSFLGLAISILAMFCCVKARESSKAATSSSGDTSGEAAGGSSTSAYNSSASAVAGVWLFVQVFLVSLVRARRPQYNVPCILWAIVANVSMVYAPQFATMAESLSFAKRFLIAYLTGFGVATGVSLFLFPMTCRAGVFATMTSYITNMRSALAAQMDYLRSLEKEDMFAAQRTNTEGIKPPRSREADVFRSKMAALASVASKLDADLPFAKREIAIGKLGPSDLQEIAKLLRRLIVPMTGLSYLSDIFERTSEERGWDRSRNYAQADVADAHDEAERARIEAVGEWHELIRRLKEPFGSMVDTIDQGLEHVLVTLELAPGKPDKDRDLEGGSRRRPGGVDFAATFDKKTQEFLETKKLMLRTWCSVHDIQLPDDFFDNPSAKPHGIPDWMQTGNMTEERKRLRRQLALMLYIEYSLYIVSRETLELMLCADRLRAHGKLRRKRLIVPGLKTIRKWLVDAFLREQTGLDGDNVTDSNYTANFEMGDAYKKKDPEHLPPQTTWERESNRLRTVAHFLRSPASQFGLRVAVATMTVAVIAFLQSTQVWYTENRLFWAQIMVSIGMQPTAGNALQGYILRILGTMVAMVLSLIAWYIVDETPAGAIVFFFLFALPFPYLLLKQPRFASLAMIAPITMVLIIGYELQVRKIGVTVATSNGQAYYPIYILGPIRLASVLAGLSIAWIFTIFPFPISEQTTLRKSLGSSLLLLANYYSVLDETVRIRLSGREGDATSKNSPGHKLEKTRLKLYAKCNSHLSGLQAQARATRLDIPIGGRFPRQQYDELVERMRNLLNYMAIVGIASGSISRLGRERAALGGRGPDDGHASQWLRDFRRINREANVTSQAVTTLLVLLSSAVGHAHPLPPHLRVPEAYGLARRMDEIDADVLGVEHIFESGYAAFAVVLIGTQCISDDLKRILDGVRGLVGELDFSFRVLDGAVERESEETLVYRSRNKGD